MLFLILPGQGWKFFVYSSPPSNLVECAVTASAKVRKPASSQYVAGLYQAVSLKNELSQWYHYGPARIPFNLETARIPSSTKWPVASELVLHGILGFLVERNTGSRCSDYLAKVSRHVSDNGFSIHLLKSSSTYMSQFMTTLVGEVVNFWPLFE